MVLHQVVRENLATFLAEAEAHQGLPRHVEQEFLHQYLPCTSVPLEESLCFRGLDRVVEPARHKTVGSQATLG